MIKRILICCILCFVTACATNHNSVKRIKAEDIQRIYVLEKNNDKGIIYDSSGNTGTVLVGGMFGLVGGVISASIIEEKNRPHRIKLEALVARRGLEIEKLLVEAFNHELENSSKYVISDAKTAEAKLFVDVEYYGYTESGGELEPILRVLIRVQDNTGKQIWDSVTSYNHNPNSKRTTLPKLQRNKQLLEEHFQIASNQVANKLIKEIRLVTPNPWEI